MKIAAQQATIKTTSVEIKALTINGKQVTLAVFRQLDQLPLLDYDNQNLNGLVWGRINYCPDVKCKSLSSKHIHIVWQKDSQLFRDTIDLYDDSYHTKSEKSKEYYRNVGNQAIEVVNYLKAINAHYLNYEGKQKISSVHYDQTRNIVPLAYWDCKQKYKIESQDEAYHLEQFKEFDNLLGRHIKQEKEWEQSLCSFHKGVYENLCNVDLLFIAV
jgi:hypothetical protein